MLTPCRQHLGLGRQNRKIGGEAGVVALGCQSERLLRIIEGLLLLHQTAVE